MNFKNALNWDEKTSRKAAEKVFINMAKNGAEWIKLLSMKPKDLDQLVTEFEGSEYLDEYVASGKGGIFLASHFGNWELMAAILSFKGYGGSVIARRIYFHKYDKIITGIRNRFGVKVFYRDGSLKKILRFLGGGDFLGILADQDVDSVEGVFVDFFNKPAYTPTAPVKIAMVSKSDLIPIFLVRKPDNTHKLIVEKPIKVFVEGDKESAVKNYTQKWSYILEGYIKRYPEQWVWIHERWKTSPESIKTT